MIITLLIISLHILVCRATTVPMRPEYSCFLHAPNCLTFVEPLVDSLKPGDITIFTGGDSFERRQKGFARISADTISEFSRHHGYNLIFMDQLKLEQPTNGHRFTPHWDRAFALADLRSRFSTSRYFVWIDDDVIVPYYETDTLNHWINLMEADPEWEMMFAIEVESVFLNSGMIVFKNHDFAFGLYKVLVNFHSGKWASTPLYEQSALVEYLNMPENRHLLGSKIRRINTRQGQYTFNNFLRCALVEEFQFGRYRKGDAFAHILGTPNPIRDIYAAKLMEDVDNWRDSFPSHCKYPIQVEYT